MTTILIMLPYVAHAALMLISPTLSVVVGAALCLAAIGIDLARGRSLKLLSAGSAIVFAGLACYRGLVDPEMSAAAMHLAVDGGVFAIALGSILARFPFTLQYALEAEPAETAAMAGFRRANYVISGAWALATALMIAANLTMIYVPGLPIWAGLAIAFAARNSALYFTRWYPAYYRLKSAHQQAGAMLAAK
ncbi:hypothetical protein [Bradyrhizobium sp. STM 3557]|uniref:hypothetical protein n=1 Tax=Bradyrhizobium sp. STM 3557 TaxID=578920 RepID=UPI00388E8484